MFIVPYTNNQSTSSSTKQLDEKKSDSYIAQSLGANIMPIFNGAIQEISNINAGNNIIPEMARHSASKIFSKRAAPSTISSERFLNSRASLSPEFIHNEAATRISHVSNLYQEAPRFKNDIDILA